jgi:hypothetical protein
MNLIFGRNFFLILTIFSLCNCIDYNDYSKRRPYNPQKAGAKIIKSYDITDSIWYHFNAYADIIDIKYFFDLFDDEEFIYIRTQNNIFVFDKQTMIKTKEIEIQIPVSAPYYISQDLEMDNYQGFSIINDFALIQFPDPVKNSDGFFYPQLLTINLNNGEMKILDKAEIFDIEVRSIFPPLMGYDKANELLWLCLGEDGKSYIYFFSYNKTDKIFKFQKKTGISFFYILFDYRATAVTINDNEFWNFYYVFPQSAFIEKRNLNNPEDSLCKISVEHLGVDFLYLEERVRPGNIIYDPPYIWVLVVKNERIQMLKLLPNF